MGHDWTLEAYKDMLAVFYGFYRPLEALLIRFPREDMGIDVGPRCKAAFLEEDLRELGMSEADQSALPLCGSLPDLTSVPAALGCLYVLEGATLGGRVIVPYLKKCLDASAILGYRFFNPYGEMTGPHWKGFCNVLVSNATRSKADDVILKSACDTFQSLEEWFQRRLK
ncbi:MAG: bacteriophytochrome heme oxygenase [Fibrobacteres bacterium]|nr:bacteriophytochrome heme oxygenase [Fibrobacterota bacterium]